ncbi:MAG: EAL domain-containing protein, partial [Pseudomonadales bacterium]|nr:EAL domain-containing protein [Pseudomonadales bacterium]
VRNLDKKLTGGKRFTVLQVIDRTEKRQMQQALIKSESRFRGIIDDISLMIIIMGDDDKISYANPYACEILECTQSDILHNTFENYLSLADRSSFTKALVNCRRQPGKTITLNQLQLPNQQYLEVQLTDKMHSRGITGALIACNLITDQVHATEDLESSEEKFSTIFHSSPDATLIIRVSDKQIIDLNTSFTRLLGYTRDEILHTSGSKLNIWADDQERDQLRDKLYSDPRGLNYETDLIAKNGERLSVEMSIRLVKIQSELCIVCCGRDITRRLQAEKALLDSEEKFARIFSGSPDGIIIIRIEDKAILDVNDTFIEETGFQREALLGRSLYEVGIVENTSPMEKSAKEITETGQVYNLHLNLLTHAGDVFPTLVSISTIEIYGEASALCIVKDNREQMLTNSRLKSSEERFRKTFENAPIGILLVDVAGNIFQINNYASHLLDYGHSELINTFIYDLVPITERENLKNTLEALLISEIYMDKTERNLVRKSGVTMSTNFHTVLQKSDKGDPLHFIVQITDTTELKNSQRQMERLAFYDTLTNLANRRLFKDRLDQCIQSTQRNNSSAAILFLDLDQFKRVNDTLGHILGDKLLIEVASRLQQCVRGEDTVARSGGDEFTILLNHIVDSRDAGLVAEKILQMLREPITIDGHDLIVTTSIGIAIIPRDTTKANTLIKYADLAMYRAKEEGRNNYQYFSQDMNHKAQILLEMENSLRKALENSEFDLYYQPKVNLRNQQIEGMECLVRWHHPERGVLSPTDFIAVAEKTGIIVELGEWVIQEACRAASQVSKIAGKPISTAINISPRQFRQKNLVSFISDCIEEFELQASQLEFETTETMLLGDQEAATDALLRLHQLGVKLAIDDFGTGYSSLHHLKGFPFDIVKIDQSFIKDIPHNENDMAITGAVIAMSQRLNLKVVAEGIETKEQLEYLLENNCEYGQGYYFSKAIPLQEIARLLTPGISWLRRADR